MTFLLSETIREPAAEMLGTMLLTLIGTAGNCQAVLSTNTGVAASPKGEYLSLAIGWACSSSSLISYRASNNEHVLRCFPRCVGGWRRLWRPR